MDKKTYNNLLVSSAPHIVTNMDTTRIMMMVLIGLAPSFLVSIYVFGARVISLTLVCAVASVFFEWAWNKLMHKKQTIGDLSAVLTGVLIAFNVPSGLPYWIAIGDHSQNRAVHLLRDRNDHMAGSENGGRRDLYSDTARRTG